MIELNRTIDHAILKPEATKTAVREIINGAKEHNFFSAYINPCWVTLANEQLTGTGVAVCTVIGLPLGANIPEVKTYEAADTIKDGTNEVDTVINIGALKSQQYGYVCQGAQGVVDVAKEKALVKVVIETALLTDGEKVKVCELAKKTGADFVKTSTGFSTDGAKVAGIRLMRGAVGPDMDVKASDDVHNTEGASAIIEVGVTCIDASTGVAIISGAADEGY